MRVHYDLRRVSVQSVGFIGGSVKGLRPAAILHGLALTAGRAPCPVIVVKRRKKVILLVLLAAQ